jgi:regulator of CtrA degradation
MRQKAFFSRTYDEAMDLLVEARNYMAFRRGAPAPGLEPRLRLKASYESMRVTCRLTQVMAWLLAQRAAHEGELEYDAEAALFYAVGGESVCLDHNSDELTDLPRGLQSLLERSHNLYIRVKRLDEMAQANLGAVGFAGAHVGGRELPSMNGMA